VNENLPDEDDDLYFKSVKFPVSKNRTTALPLWYIVTELWIPAVRILAEL